MLREKYKKLSSNKELGVILAELKSSFEKEKFSAELALNMLNLFQAWTRLESVVAKGDLDASLEFSFAELLGHFYAAESIYLKNLEREAAPDELLIKQSLKASQEMLADLAAFSARYIVSGGTLESIDKVLSLNSNTGLSQQIFGELST